jgi:hypothetical protein
VQRPGGGEGKGMGMAVCMCVELIAQPTTIDCPASVLFWSPGSMVSYRRCRIFGIYVLL